MLPASRRLPLMFESLKQHVGPTQLRRPLHLHRLPVSVSLQLQPSLFFPIGMAGHTHYPNFHSNHALPQVPPISYEETDFWPQDFFAWTHDLQVSEEASILVHLHYQALYIN
jgi:hypothetical protein